MYRFLATFLFLSMAVRCFGQVTSTPPSSSEPMVIATVLGSDITVKDASRLNGIIFGKLLARYAQENKIEPTEADLDAFLAASDEAEKRHLVDLEARKATLTQELQSSSLSDRQRRDKESNLEAVDTSLRGLKPFMEQEAKQKEQMRPMKLGVAKQVVKAWKVNKALYDQYGGRVIFQQAGNEPMDAYRAFLKAEQAKGSFKILERKYETSFWEYFDVANTSVYSSEEGDKAMATPWWLKKAPGAQ